jgi:hypothetical protein
MAWSEIRSLIFPGTAMTIEDLLAKMGLYIVTRGGRSPMYVATKLVNLH